MTFSREIKKKEKEDTSEISQYRKKIDYCPFSSFCGAMHTLCHSLFNRGEFSFHKIKQHNNCYVCAIHNHQRGPENPSIVIYQKKKEKAKGIYRDDPLRRT